MAGGEGCDSEHPRRPVCCPPLAIRPVRPQWADNHSHPRDYLTLRALTETLRFLTARNYRPR